MVITMDISGRVLHMAEAEYKDGAVAVKKCAALPLPEGCVRNGVVTDEAEFVKAAAGAMKANGFTARRVCVSIGSGVIATKQMAVPDAGAKQVRGIIRGEIEQAGAGVDQRSRTAESLFDYTVLGPNAADPQKLDIMAVMLPFSVAEGWLSMIQKLGKKPGTLDCWYNSALKAIGLDSGMAACPAGIIASLDPESVNLLLFESGKYGVYRSVPVAAPGAAAQNEFILSSFENAAAPSEQDSVYAAAYDGISKLLQFQSIRARQNPVRNIYLCGALSGDEGLAARLGEVFSVAVERAPACPAAKLPEGTDYSEYFCAVGAAVRK